MSVPRHDAREIARGPRARGRRAALRLYRDWEEELAVNAMGKPHLSPTKALELEEALKLLAGRHAGLEREARTTTEPPQLSPAASMKLQAKRGAARADEAIAKGADAAGEAAGRAGAYAYRHSGAQGAARDWTRTTLQLLGAMAAVALLYLILTSAGRRRGGGSVPDALEAGAGVFAAFFSPATDVLGSGGSVSAPAGPGVAADSDPVDLFEPGVKPSPRAFGDLVGLRTGPAAALMATPGRVTLGGPLQIRRPQPRRRPSHR